MAEIELNLVIASEINNIRAEIKATLMALKACPKNRNVVLYTDCQTTCGLISRRTKLEQTNFISQSKQQPLANADLYQEFYLLFDQIKPEIHWIKGHSPDKNMNHIQKIFSHLDKATRKKLRDNII